LLISGCSTDDRAFDLIKQPARAKRCDTINRMVDEAQEVMKQFKGSASLDAGLLASAHISRYGTLKAWAEQLGLQEAEENRSGVD
jgi:ferritin-like metal-binding protein YciE